MIFFKKKSKSQKKTQQDSKRAILIKKDTRDGILSYSKMNHPNEGILILRGKSHKGTVTVDGLTIPPFSNHGTYYAGFPHSFLPLDSEYVGTAHSHPTGSAKPSVTDLHNFFGLVSIIVKSPYKEEDIFAYDRDGNELEINVIEDKQ